MEARSSARERRAAQPAGSPELSREPTLATGCRAIRLTELPVASQAGRVDRPGSASGSGREPLPVLLQQAGLLGGLRPGRRLAPRALSYTPGPLRNRPARAPIHCRTPNRRAGAQRPTHPAAKAPSRYSPLALCDIIHFPLDYLASLVGRALGVVFVSGKDKREQVSRDRPLILTSPGKCAGCNKCIARCPSPDANSSVLAGDSSFVSVDPLRCIACGACLRACDHDARYFEDDTEAFFADLARGTPISVVVAPAVRANFPRPELLLGFLKSQGVRLAFDVSFGADITTWAYLKVIGERGLDSVIAQPCPAIVNYIERYLPDLIGRLAPVHSPMMASAIYLRRYLNATERIAFLSPCVAKSDEIRAAETGGLVSYNVTFSGLLRYLERRRARLEESSPAGYDDLGCGLGLLYSRPGGLRECVEHVAPGAWVRQIEGPERAYPYLHAYGERLRAGKPVPLLVDILSCADGCNLGPGTTGEAALDDIDATFNALKASRIAQRDGWLRKPASLLRYFEKSLRVEDFQRSYRSRAEEISRTEPGAAAIAQAFAAMR
ncbi:MAG TPA: hypothetical protein DFS52_05960, partial [Myxococcales bacterium]|nr:hypothetical protein [Myxococcales bacterium]